MTHDINSVQDQFLIFDFGDIEFVLITEKIIILDQAPRQQMIARWRRLGCLPWRAHKISCCVGFRGMLKSLGINGNHASHSVSGLPVTAVRIINTQSHGELHCHQSFPVDQSNIWTP